MALVESVTGSISSDELGVVLPHEHIILFDDEKLSQIENELKDLKEAGGGTLVEMSTPALVDVKDREKGISLLKKLSQKTGIKIIYGTGFYKEPKLPYFIKEKSINELTQMMITELTVGVGLEKIRAGLIGEVGSSNYKIYDTEEKVLRAAARAHCETGAAISTHTGRASMVKEQIKIFEEENVDLTRVAIGHLDVFPRLEQLLELYRYVLDKGAYVQFDTVGKEGYHEIELDPQYGQKFPYDNERAKIIAKLVEMGYSSQLLISCDIDVPVLLKPWGGRGYSHLLENFVPLLREQGLTEQTISQILIKNPCSLLTGI